jgi:hypothetical protein
MTQFKPHLQRVPDRDGCTICTVIVFLEMVIAVEQLFVFIYGSVSLATAQDDGDGEPLLTLWNAWQA